MTITATKLYFSGDAASSDVISEELEKEFFSMIRLCGKVNKTTWGGRLADVDEHLEVYLDQTGLRPRQYLDVGVSSGIISWDWCRRLKQSGRPFEMVATDLIFRAYIVPLGPGLKVLSDRHGVALQYDFFGYGIRPGRPRPRDWLCGVVLITAVMSLLFRWYLRRLRLPDINGASDNLASKIEIDPSVREVQLISPRIKGNQHISFVEDDLFSRAPDEMVGKFDVIRVANLLNHDYFDEKSMLQICQRLKQCMAGKDSLLIVCRTRSDNSNHGTLFRLTAESRLIPVDRFGEGSEIESIVTQA